jgi:large subunit ribosomal protein L33
MKKEGQRTKIALVCSVCKRQNYLTEKNKTNTPDKLELKKFCRRCRKPTLHKETQRLK